MWILPLIGYAGILIGFGFLTLAIASGLYYLSELVEEYTVFARKLLTRLIYVIIFLQLLLVIVDRFPVSLSLLSIGSHVVYAGNLRHFPVVKLLDPVFLLSCFLVLANHFLWFRHFSTPPAKGSAGYPTRYDARLEPPSFTEIASYFGICIWLVPFALFVSLSAGENVLPSMGSEYATGDTGTNGSLEGIGLSGGTRTASKTKGLVKASIDNLREWIGDNGQAMGLWPGDKRRF